ncbi:trypsin-like peptidase domain-containing protein [Paenalkalicoccus suaedae]|uniref:Trypsin-like peptidase domain-containing protein n=1 Tax=Paenalkalicoccus suaedae TaxID=2592382 RepID=A0A859FCV2_9BACI|nr:serine protease [Paenalkalicoccus suaedae]QKS71173.1 trypsin-like peptidase domain-containing protein [Paenalkalicoccus suaedae]
MQEDDKSRHQREQQHGDNEEVLEPSEHNDAEQNGSVEDDSELNVDEQKEEELFFDGENYYTKEEFFSPDEEEVSPKKRKRSRAFKVVVAGIITVALLANVFAIWPQLFNIPAFEFLATSQELSSNEDVQTYKESVVIVRTDDSKGTGFVIDDSLIMTNEHVIDRAVSPVVAFDNGDSYVTEPIYVNEELDMAILRVEDENFDHPSLPLTTDYAENELVYVIGNPLFFNFIPNEGTLLADMSVSSKEVPVMSLDAPIYRGSSGSPVINTDGEVVGLVFATSSSNGSRVGLAIKMQDIVPLLEEIER